MNLHRILSNAAKKRAIKLGHAHFSKMAKLSFKKRTAGMNDKEISAYMSNVRNKANIAP